MTAQYGDDEQELLRLFQLMLDSAHEGGVANLQQYMHDDFLLTYSLYEQDKRGLLNKEQIIARWGSQQASEGTATVSEQRILLAGDTAVIFALITDTFSDPTKAVVRTWVSDVWVKHHSSWRWLASHESFLK